MNSLKKPVQEFAQILLARDVQYVVICPGSRNAPFIIQLNNHPEIKKMVMVDERSAAFFALGIAQQTGRPAVIISTSGTAALNFGPAIAEAYYQRIPLIAVTADRPPEWIDQGEGQSIRQSGVFSNYCKLSVDISDDLGDSDRLWHMSRLMNEAFNMCEAAPQGPVHLNFPLKESLYLTGNAFPALKKTSILPVYSLPDEMAWTELVEELSSASRVLVLAGQLKPDSELNKAVNDFALLPQVAVFTETHANLHGPDLIPTIDRWIMATGEDSKHILKADIVITVGLNIISRKIKDIIRKSEASHWHIDEASVPLDTFRLLNRVIPLDPTYFFAKMSMSMIGRGNFRQEVKEHEKRIVEAAKVALQEAAFSDLTAVAEILKQIPAHGDIQMGNSSIVRYIQLFDQREDLCYFGNRGVSGIDGCSSTSVGAAFASGKSTVLLSGDLAFFYDSNAFWNEYVGGNLKVIVINNGGGGIFRIIDGPGETELLDEFFEAAHARSVAGLAAMYDIPCTVVDSLEDLKNNLKDFFSQQGCAILEVRTPRLENDIILKKFFSSLLRPAEQDAKNIV